MVRLTEVEDEHFTQAPEAAKDTDPVVVDNNEEDNDDEFSDTGVSITVPSPSYSDLRMASTWMASSWRASLATPPLYLKRQRGAFSTLFFANRNFSFRSVSPE